MNILYIWLFIVGAGTGVDITLLGRVGLSEIFMVIGLPFLLFTDRGRRMNGVFARLLALIGVYMFAIILTDIVHKNEFALFLRGFARPIFLLLITLFFTFAIKRDPKCLIFFFLGTIPGACLGYFDTSELLDELVVGSYNFFSAKWAPIIASVTMFSSFLLYRFSRFSSVLPIIIGGTVIAVYGSRSDMLAYMMTIFSFLLMGFLNSRRNQAQLNKMFLLKLATFSFLAVSIIYFTYIYVAPSGLLGELQQSKFYAQSSTRFGVTPWGILLAGRLDFLTATLAVIDAPLLGHGSWPKTGEYTIQAMYLLNDTVNSHELSRAMYQIDSGHSVFMGTWMNHGIFAAAYWAYVMYLSIQVMLFFIYRETLLSPLLFLPFFMFAWAFLFSPFNLNNRLYAGLFSALAICFVDRKRPLISRQQFDSICLRDS